MPVFDVVVWRAQGHLLNLPAQPRIQLLPIFALVGVQYADTNTGNEQTYRVYEGKQWLNMQILQAHASTRHPNGSCTVDTWAYQPPCGR
jgi:hypothetical protein